MPKSRIILTLGFLIALLPILGFPHAWESFFQIFAGLGIVLLSVMISVDKRLSQKAKAEKRLSRRRTQTETEVANHSPVVHFGRRQSDQVVVNQTQTISEEDSNKPETNEAV